MNANDSRPGTFCDEALLLTREVGPKALTCAELHILKVAGLGFEPRSPVLPSLFFQEPCKVRYHSCFSHEEIDTHLSNIPQSGQVEPEFKFFVVTYKQSLELKAPTYHY